MLHRRNLLIAGGLSSNFTVSTAAYSQGLRPRPTSPVCRAIPGMQISMIVVAGTDGGMSGQLVGVDDGSVYLRSVLLGRNGHRQTLELGVFDREVRLTGAMTDDNGSYYQVVSIAIVDEIFGRPSVVYECRKEQTTARYLIMRGTVRIIGVRF